MKTGRIWVRNLIRQAFDKQVREDYREFERLKDFPRYTPSNTILFGKKIIFLDAASYIFQAREIFKHNIYKFHANESQLNIIDCGANIGLSVIYLKRLFPNSRVVAFEPDPAVFYALKQNLASFGFDDVEIINKAVWSNATKLDFYREGADAGRIAVETDKSNLVTVDTVSLRPYLIGKRIDFLKVDIEGAENIVLEDCKDLLLNVQRLFVEYHSFVNREQALDRLLRILKDAGFRYYISPGGVVSPNPLLCLNNYMGMDNQLNVFATR